MNLNVGGGKFDHLGWLNLDERTGFVFSEKCTFPIGNKTAPIVYSSHCLEHLDDATVDRVLQEARRVCDGSLVLKLPDFEDVIRRMQNGDRAYFGKQWGQQGLVHMWEKDSLEHRASMIFCGYWNKEYGHEFTGPRNPQAEGAYHGPCGIPDWSLSPHAISQSLKAKAPKGATFNHQNAWSRNELIELLTEHGFMVESMDADEICKLPIPTIGEMKGISMYVLAS